MKRIELAIPIVVIALVTVSGITGLDLANAKTPSPPPSVLENLPEAMRDQFVPRVPAPFPVAKRPGHYTAKDWAFVIDSTWGPGLTWAQHKYIWETFWANIDTYFACFPGLDSSIWQDVWNRYNPEILDTVSRGRLDAIMEWASASLRESHTYAFDAGVLNTELTPGVPLLVVGFTGVVDHFGAGLTVLPDSSLLVYKAVNPHPLGLAPGDLVLGYDRRPWKQIYPELMAAELPRTGSYWGSNPKAFTETFLVTAGMNWHLFDTIDIVRHVSGDTLHLPTSLLQGQDMTLWASEQLDVPGVKMPNYVAGELTSFGVITGTHIGYVYSYGWNSQTDVNNCVAAFDSLRNVYNVDGVIFDLRTNYGGVLAYNLFDYLFDTSGQAAISANRCSGGGHFSLCQYSSSNIPGAVTTHWDRPLAILTGPGALSAGDINPMILSRLPKTKLFGKPSAGAFSGAPTYSLYSGWVARVTTRAFYLPNHPPLDYLVRKEFPSVKDFPWVNYQPVWLTPDGVAAGKDDVVEAALAWLTLDSDTDGVIDLSDNCPTVANADQSDANLDGIGDACCCIALTGNVDCDPGDGVDISDLAALIDNLYITFTGLCCTTEANVDGQPGIDISDLSALIDYLYISFTPTAGCQ